MTLVAHHPFVYAHAPEPFVAIEIDSHNIIDYNPPFASEFCNPDVPLYSRSFSQNLVYPSQIDLFSKKLTEFFEKHTENIRYKRTVPISEVSYSNRHHIPLRCLSLRDSQFPKYIQYDWFIFTESGEETPDVAFLCGRPAGPHGTEEDRKMYLEFVDFFDNAPIALHWLSFEGIILWANKTEMAFLGYTREEFIGQPIIKFCVDEEYVGGLFKSLSCGETIQDCPIRLRAKDGKIRDILVDSNVNWNPDGSWNHTRCFLRDDTKRKVEEAKIKEQRDAAQRLVKDKDEFLQTVVHDLRTPMNGLLGLVQYITSVIDNLPSTQQDQLHETAGMIQQAGHELCVLLDNIIDATKFDEGFFAKPNLKKFNLSDLVERHKERFFRVVESSNLPIYVALGFRDDSNVFSKEENGNRKNWEVYGDESMLRRVLENLLSNSLKFTSRGSIVIEVLCRRAKWFETDQPGEDGRLKRLVGLFQISIIDTGVGISKEHINRVFEKYWQLLPENTKEEENTSQYKMGRGGNGIGLNICKKLINSMGGEIKVKSTPNIGTTIRCTIPLEIAISGDEEPVVCNWPMRFEVPFTVKNTPNPSLQSLVRYPSQQSLQTQVLPPQSQPQLLSPQSQPKQQQQQPQQQQPQPQQPQQQQPQPQQQQPQPQQQQSQPQQPQQQQPPQQQQQQPQEQPQLKQQPQPQQKTQSQLQAQAQAQLQEQGQLRAHLQAQAKAQQQKPQSQAQPQPQTQEQPQPHVQQPPQLQIQLETQSQLQPQSPRNRGIEPLLPSELPQDVYFSDTTTTKNPVDTVVSSSTTDTQDSRVPLYILVVDDNLLCQKVATRFLSQLGATVDIATNGLEAIVAYNKAIQNHRVYDVILMDLRMPRMDGITAANKLTTENSCTIPIIAVTCEKSRDRLDDCFKTGKMTAVLNKPIVLKELVEVLKKALPNKGIKTSNK